MNLLNDQTLFPFYKDSPVSKRMATIQEVAEAVTTAKNQRPEAFFSNKQQMRALIDSVSQTKFPFLNDKRIRAFKSPPQPRIKVKYIPSAPRVLKDMPIPLEDAGTFGYVKSLLNKNTKQSTKDKILKYFGEYGSAPIRNRLDSSNSVITLPTGATPSDSLDYIKNVMPNEPTKNIASLSFEDANALYTRGRFDTASKLTDDIIRKVGEGATSTKDTDQLLNTLFKADHRTYGGFSDALAELDSIQAHAGDVASKIKANTLLNVKTGAFQGPVNPNWYTKGETVVKGAFYKAGLEEYGAKYTEEAATINLERATLKFKTNVQLARERIIEKLKTVTGGADVQDILREVQGDISDVTREINYKNKAWEKAKIGKYWDHTKHKYVEHRDIVGLAGIARQNKIKQFNSLRGLAGPAPYSTDKLELAGEYISGLWGDLKNGSIGSIESALESSDMYDDVAKTASSIPESLSGKVALEDIGTYFGLKDKSTGSQVVHRLKMWESQIWENLPKIQSGEYGPFGYFTSGMGTPGRIRTDAFYKRMRELGIDTEAIEQVKVKLTKGKSKGKSIWINKKKKEYINGVFTGRSVNVTRTKGKTELITELARNITKREIDLMGGKVVPLRQAGGIREVVTKLYKGAGGSAELHALQSFEVSAEAFSKVLYEFFGIKPTVTSTLKQINASDLLSKASNEANIVPYIIPKKDFYRKAQAMKNRIAAIADSGGYNAKWGSPPEIGTQISVGESTDFSVVSEYDQQLEDGFIMTDETLEQSSDQIRVAEKPLKDSNSRGMEAGRDDITRNKKSSKSLEEGIEAERAQAAQRTLNKSLPIEKRVKIFNKTELRAEYERIANLGVSVEEKSNKLFKLSEMYGPSDDLDNAISSIFSKDGISVNTGDGVLDSMVGEVSRGDKDLIESLDTIKDRAPEYNKKVLGELRDIKSYEAAQKAEAAAAGIKYKGLKKKDLAKSYTQAVEEAQNSLILGKSRLVVDDTARLSMLRKSVFEDFAGTASLVEDATLKGQVGLGFKLSKWVGAEREKELAKIATTKQNQILEAVTLAKKQIQQIYRSLTGPLSTEGRLMSLNEGINESGEKAKTFRINNKKLDPARREMLHSIIFDRPQLKKVNVKGASYLEAAGSEYLVNPSKSTLSKKYFGKEFSKYFDVAMQDDGKSVNMVMTRTTRDFDGKALSILENKGVTPEVYNSFKKGKAYTVGNIVKNKDGKGYIDKLRGYNIKEAKKQRYALEVDAYAEDAARAKESAATSKSTAVEDTIAGKAGKIKQKLKDTADDAFKQLAGARAGTSKWWKGATNMERGGAVGIAAGAALATALVTYSVFKDRPGTDPSMVVIDQKVPDHKNVRIIPEEGYGKEPVNSYVEEYEYDYDEIPVKAMGRGTDIRFKKTDSFKNMSPQARSILISKSMNRPEY